MNYKPIFYFVSGIAALILLDSNLLFGDEKETDVTPANEPTSMERGATLLASYGCSSCHKISGIYGTPGTIGQPLQKWRQRNFIAGRFPNTKENLVRWIRFPQQLKPGTGMPHQNVTEEEANDMVNYLYEH